jgi:hypothetical protein
MNRTLELNLLYIHAGDNWPVRILTVRHIEGKSQGGIA